MKIVNLSYQSSKRWVDRILSTTEEEQSANLESSKSDSDRALQPSSRFEVLQAELTRLRPDLSRESIASLVSEKKSKVGGGYLTDQGALFLVASDLGVTLKPLLFDSTTPSKSQSESNADLTTEARILGIAPPKFLRKRGDSSPVFVLKIIVYNSSSTIAASIWSYSIISSFIRSNFAPGDGIRIRGALSKKMTGNSEEALSISDRGELTRIDDENNSSTREIPRILDRAIDLEQLKTVPLGMSAVISGKMSSPVRAGEFKRKDGTDSRYLSFGMTGKDQDGREKNSGIRIVIWDNLNPIFERLRLGELITLLNVKPKMTEFQGTKNLEIHGDDTTGILEHWNETKVWIEGRLGLIAEEIKKSSTLLFTDSKIAQRPSPFIARILSIERNLAGNKGNSLPIHLFLIDSWKRQIAVTVQDEALENISSLRIDDVIVCRPDSFDQAGLRAIFKEKGSISKVKPERKDIPRTSSLASTIAKLEPNSVVSIDSMVLSITPSRDIETKEGLVKRSEALLADPSGEIRIYAWRSLSKHLDKLAPGDRLWVHACEVQSHEGRKFVIFKNYSRIEIRN